MTRFFKSWTFAAALACTASALPASFGMCHETAATGQVSENKTDDEESDSQPKSIYDFKVKSIDGKDVDLSKYKGKTVLLVNVASKCGYTKQYEDMQVVYEKYKDRDFVVLGFPCNQFGGQEPGSEEDIKQFCTANYGVTFPMFSKVEVNGDGQAPLYKYLTGLETKPKEKGNISWNFEKFLIGPDGNVVGRYASKVNPQDKELVKKIESLIPEQKN